MYIMFFLSPSGSVSSCSGPVRLSTGADSPVSAASSTFICAVSMHRMSAGTILPASSSTMSPGTISAPCMVAGAPLRTTVAVAAAIFFRAAIAASARYSWTKPITALRTTITTMAMVSDRSPITPDMTAAIISTMIMKSLN